MEATRKRLEALLVQLEKATATADHTIKEVREALKEISDERQSQISDVAASQKRGTPAGESIRPRKV